jgi:hypothetical protein
VEDQWPSRRAANSVGSLYRSAPSHPGGRLIEFLTQMPIGAMILLTLAVLGLAATLIVLRW